MAKVILPRTNIVRGYNPNLHSAPAPAPREPISMTPAPAEPQEHSERVLLLEDEAQTNFILREYLGSLGYQVVAVANGVDGLKEVMKSDFELVICDMMMPKLPGDMFYLAVQKTRPQLCNRFVFITGHQQNPKIDAFIERTHSAILVKPFRLQQLEVTLETILSRFPKKFRPVETNDPPAQVTERVATIPSPIPLPEEKSTSMVGRALKMVGFGRNNTPAPVETTRLAPAAQQPQVARETRKVTRRIAHLANAPLTAPPEGAIGKFDPNTPRRITRRIAIPSVLPPTGEIVKPVPPPTPAALAPRVTRKVATTQTSATPQGALTAPIPKVTRNLSKPAAQILRVKDVQPTPAASPRVTRKVAAASPAPTPKVTRNIPKVTIRVPKTTVKVAAPKTLPKTTLKIAPPKVTGRIAPPKVTAKVAPKSSIKVTAKVSRRIENSVPPPPAAPLVTRRIASAKKAS